MVLEFHPPAKINLALEIVSKRPDGYHEIRTVYQSVDLCDRLCLERSSGEGLTLHVDPEGGSAPEGEANLVVRAYRAYARHYRSVPGVRADLLKRIPSGAGLGGGSSDAAAMLLGLHRLAEREGSDADLVQLARGLGADVPYFLLGGGTALGVSRGDEVFPLPEMPERPVVMVLPRINVSTARAYSAVSAMLTSRENRISIHLCFNEKGGFTLSRQRQRNDLEPVVFCWHPEIRSLKDALYEAGADLAAMSGSGSAVYGIFREWEGAGRAARALEDLPCDVVVTRTLGREAYRQRIHRAP